MLHNMAVKVDEEGMIEVAGPLVYVGSIEMAGKGRKERDDRSRRRNIQPPRTQSADDQLSTTAQVAFKDQTAILNYSTGCLNRGVLLISKAKLIHRKGSTIFWLAR